MTLIAIVLTLFWLLAVSSFARWRIGRLRQGGVACVHLLNDWAMQLFLKGSGSILLALILTCLILCL